MRGETRPHRSRAQKPRNPSCWLHAAVGQIRLRSPALLRIFARRSDARVGAVVVDHGLQADSAEVAASTAETLTNLGLYPVLTERVQVPQGTMGPEMAARTARYGAFERAVHIPAHGLFCWGIPLTTRRKPCSWGLGAARAHAPSPECRPCASKTE